MKLSLRRRMDKQITRQSNHTPTGSGSTALIHAKKAPASLYTHINRGDGKRVPLG